MGFRVGRSLGALMKVAGVKDTLWVHAITPFIGRVTEHASAYAKVKAAAGDGEVSPAEILRLSTALWGSLHSQLEALGSCSDPNSLMGQALLAVQRLQDRVDGLGIEWLKGIMADPDSDSAKGISSFAAGVLKPPTPVLRKSLSTCSLVVQASKLTESLSAFEAEKQQKGIGGIAELMPLFVQACSVDAHLLKAISPETDDAALKFRSAVEGHLAEHVSEFTKNFTQLQTLTAKYA